MSFTELTCLNGPKHALRPSGDVIGRNLISSARIMQAGKTSKSYRVIRLNKVGFPAPRSGALGPPKEALARSGSAVGGARFHQLRFPQLGTW